MSNSLATVHPELIVEWSDRNLPLTPDSVTFGSNKKVWWKGACGHEWETSIKARSSGEKCPLSLIHIFYHQQYHPCDNVQPPSGNQHYEVGRRYQLVYPGALYCRGRGDRLDFSGYLYFSAEAGL